MICLSMTPPTPPTKHKQLITLWATKPDRSQEPSMIFRDKFQKDQSVARSATTLTPLQSNLDSAWKKSSSRLISKSSKTPYKKSWALHSRTPSCKSPLNSLAWPNLPSIHSKLKCSSCQTVTSASLVNSTTASKDYKDGREEVQEFSVLNAHKTQDVVSEQDQPCLHKTNKTKWTPPNKNGVNLLWVLLESSRKLPASKLKSSMVSAWSGWARVLTGWKAIWSVMLVVSTTTCSTDHGPTTTGSISWWDAHAKSQSRSHQSKTSKVKTSTRWLPLTTSPFLKQQLEEMPQHQPAKPLKIKLKELPKKQLPKLKPRLKKVLTSSMKLPVVTPCTSSVVSPLFVLVALLTTAIPRRMKKKEVMMTDSLPSSEYKRASDSINSKPNQTSWNMNLIYYNTKTLVNLTYYNT